MLGVWYCLPSWFSCLLLWRTPHTSTLVGIQYQGIAPMHLRSDAIWKEDTWQMKWKTYCCVFLEEGVSLARPALAVPGNKFTRLSFSRLDEPVLEKSCRPSFADQIPGEDSLCQRYCWEDFALHYIQRDLDRQISNGPSSVTKTAGCMFIVHPQSLYHWVTVLCQLHLP